MNARKCRVCGCTEQRACLTPAGPCHWIEEDLCSSHNESLRLTQEDISALESVPPLMIELDAGAAFNLIAVIQLACRHPALRSSGSQAAEMASGFARLLAEKLAVTQNISAVLEAGWYVPFDVPFSNPAPEVEERRIIIP